MIMSRRRGIDFQIPCNTFFVVFVMSGRTKFRQSRIWRWPFGYRTSQLQPRKVKSQEYSSTAQSAPDKGETARNFRMQLRNTVDPVSEVP